ncbi:tape measure protein [Phyllobacterium myrsinacearum]|uniref:Tape measure domain-containing protein n=1 Tax=Phyllobacterium myrsinacearum TaxID=28101 RepID=A0A839ENS1_9HYPH|nr:tape measure protein [Phyllobacterium myrsinacearum]MBA8881731.1 tape measure domain-containing protein [Phyllobacterium myrsinacearum]
MTAIRVELELADGNFTTRMLHAGQSVAQFNREIAASSPRLQAVANAGGQVIRSYSLADMKAKGFLSTMRDLSIVLGVVGLGMSKLANIQSSWVGDIVRVNMEFQKLAFQMKSMSTALDPIREAADNVKYLREMAMNAPFSIQTLNNAFVKLKATGMKDVNETLQALVDGVAAFGGTDEALQRITLGISQMAGKGVIQMEELRQQLGESMPTAVQQMAQAMGISMSELIKEIGTGTVAAKPAIAALVAEIERGYGGRALSMMQTFEGQLKKTYTALQTLSLEAGGLQNGSYTEGGFMSELRKQLQDVNRILSSEIGTNLARSLGSGLTTAVQYIRKAIDALIAFREEGFRTAMIVGKIFVASKMISGVSAMIGGIGRLRQALALTGTDFTRSKRSLDVLMNSFSSSVTGMTRARLSFATAGSFLRGIAGAAAALPPVLSLIGIGVVAVAEYFDLFSNKGKDAMNTLKEFGAASKDTLDIASDYIKKQEEDFAKLTQMREASARNSANMALPGLVARYRGISTEQARKELEDEARQEFDVENDYAAKSLEIQENKRLLAKRSKELESRERAEALDEYRNQVNEELQLEQAAYLRRRQQIQDEFDAEEKALGPGKSASAIRERRGKALIEQAVELYNTRERLMKEMLAKEEKALDDSSNVTARKGIEERITYILDQINQVKEARQSASEQEIGALKFEAPLNDEKLFSKGEIALERVQAEVKGLVGELSGANAEVEELKAKLAANQPYGDMGRAEVQKLVDKLVEATAAKELLDKLLKGKRDLADDIDKARLDALEEQAKLEEELSGKTLSTAEKIELKIKNGAYKGFGPAKLTLDQYKLIVSALDLQGNALTQVGDVARNNAFGSATQTAIQTTNDKLREMSGIVTGIGNGLTGLSFNGLNQFAGGGLALPGGNSKSAQEAAAKGFLDLIGYAEGTDKGRGYNETLGFGKFTGGDQNLVGMTLDQIDQLQSAMLKHPDNNFNSSALGRYQIVQQTLRGLRDEMGLGGNQLFSADLQDSLATRLASRRGNSVAGLRNEWEGLRRIDPGLISNAYTGGINAKMSGPRVGKAPTVSPAAAPAIPTYAPDKNAVALQQQMNDLEVTYKQQISDIVKIEQENEGNKKRNDAVKLTKSLNDEIEEQKNAIDQADVANKRYLATRRALEKRGVDLNSAEAKAALAAARELDQLTERSKKVSQANNAEEKFKERQLELNKQLEEAQARIGDPNSLKSSSGYRALRQELEAYVRDVEAAYGKESTAYSNAQAYKTQMLRQFSTVEGMEKAATWRKDTIELNRSLGTEMQQRRAALDQQIAEIDAAVAQFQGSEEQKVEFVRIAEAKKAAIRAQYNQEMNPMQKQMAEWGDMQGNLIKQSTQWMDNIAGGITDLIMGTGDLKSVISSILKDMVNMGVKYMMSGMFGNKGQSAGGGGKKAGMAAGGGAKKGAPLMGVGLYHAGGMIGHTKMHTAVNPRAFVGAQKFHAGGIIGGPKLQRDEVPIVTRKGEGVFTKEQMAAMGAVGGAQMYAPQFNMPVTVNASGGSADQNRDLAQQTSRELKSMVKSVMAEEFQNQRRPGGMMSKTK